MDKQLIERMKAEVRAEMRSTFSPSVEAFIDAYTDRLLARIDAERGKGAVAWVAHGNSNGIVWNSARLALDDNQPLFLFPTTPEGMVMVDKKLLSTTIKLTKEASETEFNRQPLSDELYGVSLMLAAAGEK